MTRDFYSAMLRTFYSPFIFCFFNILSSLELYFKDSRSLLIVFLDKKRRTIINQKLAAITNRQKPELTITPGTVRPHMLGRASSRMLSGLKGDELSTATRKWQTREISNVRILHVLINLLTHWASVHIFKHSQPNLRSKSK